MEICRSGTRKCWCIYQTRVCLWNEKFQHWPWCVTDCKHSTSVPSTSVKRWNFDKDNGKHFSLNGNEYRSGLLPSNYKNLNQVYQEFYSALLLASINISYSHCSNYLPCWDFEYKTFDCSFLCLHLESLRKNLIHPCRLDKITGWIRLGLGVVTRSYIHFVLLLYP